MQLNVIPRTYYRHKRHTPGHKRHTPGHKRHTPGHSKGIKIIPVQKSM